MGPLLGAGWRLQSPRKPSKRKMSSTALRLLYVSQCFVLSREPCVACLRRAGAQPAFITKPGWVPNEHHHCSCCRWRLWPDKRTSRVDPPPFPVWPFGTSPDALWCLLGGVSLGGEGFPLAACGKVNLLARNLSPTHSITDGCLREHPWVSQPSAERATGSHSPVSSTWRKTAWKTFSCSQSWNKWSDLSKIYHPNKEIHPFLKSRNGSPKRPKMFSHFRTVWFISA